MIRIALSAAVLGGLLLSAAPAAAQGATAASSPTRASSGEVTKSQVRRHHQAAYEACTKATQGDNGLLSYSAFGKCMDKHGKLVARASTTSH